MASATSTVEKFDFKKHWLALDQQGREAFAQDAGTTSHYIQTHYTGRRKIPTKSRMDKLYQACKKRGWLTDQQPLLAFFFQR
ncbi:TPA: hypothetical protein JD203_03670 [Cronobacter sakazakii]|uniref:hypothetical protein n=1 Tax=Enterobacteriaceae TaxID=543 RepID=UPI000975D660|nr:MULTISPECIES: hypothetical protein [Enterobacteriaceae]EIZ8816806.1 hypothetical protein [Cronobacter sakazakii]EJO9548331.1 hypothetical protein [Cronobacter sakazakii]EKF8821429.1 hypothetical protein [Cronobacter sakazakii]ELY4089614.1 hypothetical protein [Cronobacter sakazakii]ELY4225663.1 hypothetical protein [Cronobacter sakazakii]